MTASHGQALVLLHHPGWGRKGHAQEGHQHFSLQIIPSDWKVRHDCSLHAPIPKGPGDRQGTGRGTGSPCKPSRQLRAQTCACLCDRRPEVSSWDLAGQGSPGCSGWQTSLLLSSPQNSLQLRGSDHYRLSVLERTLQIIQFQFSCPGLGCHSLDKLLQADLEHFQGWGNHN